ncbi:MAG: hypothetical protein Q7T67_02060, partial [Patulibacter sp.]
RRRARDPQVARAGEGVGVVVRSAAPTSDAEDGDGAPRPAGSTSGTGATPTAGGAGGPAESAVAIVARGARGLGELLTGDRTVRVAPAEVARSAPRCRLVGGVRPAPEGAAGRLQRRDGRSWRTVRRVPLRGGGFETVVPKRGEWRVRVGRFSTPAAKL